LGRKQFCRSVLSASVSFVAGTEEMGRTRESGEKANQEK
jgi:hypothetical protein